MLRPPNTRESGRAARWKAIVSNPAPTLDRRPSRLTGMRLVVLPVVPLLCAKNGISPGHVTLRSRGKAVCHHSSQNASYVRSGTRAW